MSKDDDIEIEKSNIVLVGETGTGKTLIARTIAKMLDVPFAIVDATVLTEAGYVGEDVETILTRLFRLLIIRLTRQKEALCLLMRLIRLPEKVITHLLPEMFQEKGFSKRLLKLLEGTVVNVPPKGGRKHPDQKFVEVDTKNILFIAGGAFSGIDKSDR